MFHKREMREAVVVSRESDGGKERMPLQTDYNINSNLLKLQMCHRQTEMTCF